MNNDVYVVIEHIEHYDQDSELVPEMEIKGVFSSLGKAKEYIKNNFKKLIPDVYGLKCDLGGKIVKEYNFTGKPAELGITIEKYKIN